MYITIYITSYLSTSAIVLAALPQPHTPVQNKDSSEQQHVNANFSHLTESSPSKHAGNQVVSNGEVTTVSGGCIAHATQVSVTGTLLLVSTVFVLLNLPSYIMRIYVFILSHQDAEAQLSPSPNSLPYVLQRYFMLLYYTNFAINFVLYNASSRLFRRTLWGHLRRRWLALCDSIAELRSNLRHSSCHREEIA